MALPARMQPAVPIETLKKRADFLRLSKASGRISTQTLILLAGPQPKDISGPARARIGLTVTKKLGQATIRNRIKRRLRAAVREVAQEGSKAGYDYVIIARIGALQDSYGTILRDLRYAFRKIHQKKSDVPPTP